MCSLYVKTVLTFVMVFHSSYCLKNQGSDCPQMYKRTYEGYIPKGNNTAGTYIFFENITDTEDCISKCCSNKTCNAALMFNKKCYNVDCKSNEMCIPKLHHNPKLRENITMVLVKPDHKNESWVKILKSEDKRHENWKESCPKLYEYTYKGYLPRGNLSTGNFSYIEQITDLKNCILNCCDNDKCNVAIMHANKCYNVVCKSSKLCIPSLHHNGTTRKLLKMVLVKPVDHRDHWKDILNRFNESQDGENSDEILPEISSSEETTTISTLTRPARKISDIIKLRLPDFNTEMKMKSPNNKLKIDWTQIEGPTKLKFSRQNGTSFDITKIIAGNYLIKLSITEEEKSTNFTNTEHPIQSTDRHEKIEDTTENELETTDVNENHSKQTV